MSHPLSLDALFASLPPEWQPDPFAGIQKMVQASGRKLIVLDDDPTGTQTVHGVAVLTKWSVERLAAELQDPSPALYLLTNTRSMTLRGAQALNTQAAQQIQAAARLAGRDFAIISRSDSTLRGHFPGELDALSRAFDQPFDAWLLVPYFREGGRYTANDTHYVVEGSALIPAGETQFARDKVFGYRASSLPEWVEEKTNGRVLAGEVHTISIDTLRRGGPQAAAAQLLALPRGAVCAVNAASDRDIEVLVLALLQAEAAGKRFLYRTAASFVRVRAGIAPRPLLQPEEITATDSGAGLIVAGSYVPKTSAQLTNLFATTSVLPIEVQVERLLEEETRQMEIERTVQAAEVAIAQGRDAAVYTSRALVSAQGEAANLEIGSIVSASLVQIVRRIRQRPRYLLAKGGITSSDIAVHGLGIQRAVVLGQILPGIPVWQCGEESRFPSMPYIVFPGNVGGEDALSAIVRRLKSTNTGGA